METIKDLSAKLASGETSAVALAQASLAKIESTKNLNAYISVLNERALAKAAESDKRRAEGKSLDRSLGRRSRFSATAEQGQRSECANRNQTNCSLAITHTLNLN